MCFKRESNYTCIMQRQTNKVPESSNKPCTFTSMRTESDKHMTEPDRKPLITSVLNQKHMCMHEIYLIHLNLTALLMLWSDKFINQLFIFILCIYFLSCLYGSTRDKLSQLEIQVLKLCEPIKHVFKNDKLGQHFILCYTILQVNTFAGSVPAKIINSISMLWFQIK